MSYKTNIHFNKVLATNDYASIVEILPHDSHISYYHKARALFTPFYTILVSYETPILVYKDGQLIRLSDGYTVERNYGMWGRLPETVQVSATTLRHIKSFCGINKKEYLALPYDYEVAKNWIQDCEYWFDKLGVKL